MQFRKIVTVDNCGLQGPYKHTIAALAETVIEHADDPAGTQQIIERIGDADCVLVSWRTPIPAEVLSACRSVRYIGMCCSLYDEASANVDIAAARQHDITVKGVKDYGDEGTVEFIFAQLVNVYKGLGTLQWGDEPTELGGKCFGVIGMGTLGTMVARMALSFGMKVVYHSRTSKPDAEKMGVARLDLDALLGACDVVSLHLPRNTSVLGAREFALLKDGAILVNTSLGRPFDADAFSAWIRRNERNIGIFDRPGCEAVLAAGDTHPRILVYPRSSGFTREAKDRLTRKVYENMAAYLTNA